MPITSYNAALHSVAWFEHPNVNILQVSGEDALDLLQRMSTNDVHEIPKGTGKQTILTSDKGRIVDILTAINFGEYHWWLPSGNNLGETVQWFRKYIIMDDVRFMDVSDQWHCFEIIGPSASQVLTELNNQFPLKPELFSIQKIIIENVHCLVMRVPSISDVSYKIFAPHQQIDILSWFLGISESIPEIDFLDYEILRIEKGIGKSPNEYTINQNPLEAGLIHLINFKKGCYIGQEVIARLDTYNKVKSRLVGFKSGLLLPFGAKIIIDNNEVGHITSCCESYQFGFISLGYIRQEYAIDGIKIQMNDGSESYDAELTILPFHKIQK